MNTEVFVDNIDYDRFVQQIKVAELFAKENELGLWKKIEEQ